MPAIAPEPAPTAAPDSAPRIVVFGHPGSGKSSLLGALLQASDLQPDLLEAEIVEPGPRLEQLREALYGTLRVEPVRTPIVTHHLVVQPLPTEGEAPPPPYPIVVVDCDGAAANAILKHPDNPLTDVGLRSGSLAQAVVLSDVLLLALSADDTAAERSRAFDDFLLFLERLHGRKAFARDVGGTPIVLVLTQCDRLARLGDTRERWAARVDTELQSLTQQLREELHDDRPPQSPYLNFGSVEVQGYAVATHRPRLADDPAPPDEPHGVAELFRDCFALATQHRERTAHAELRLSWTVRGALTAVLLMILGVFLIVCLQPPAANTLADRIRDYRDRTEPAPEVRLAAKNLNQTELLLNNFRDNPAFADVPDDLRRFVESRLVEVGDYRQLRATLNDPAPRIPAEARTEKELDAVRARLSSIPIRPEWSLTEAAAQRAKWFDDIALIEKTAKGWRDWYFTQAAAADSLMKTTNFDAKWLADIERWRMRSEHPGVRDVAPWAEDRGEVRLEQPVPGAQPALGPRDKVVTYGATYYAEQSSSARDVWRAADARVRNLRNLADALALTPLDAARPIHGSLFVPLATTAPPTERLDRLRKSLPADFHVARDWRLSQYDLKTAQPVLAARVAESQANAERAARSEIRTKFDQGSPPGTPEAQRWRELGTALAADARIRAWGELLHVLARLSDPTAPDPVMAMIDFLKRERFEIVLAGFDLRIPKSYQPRGKEVVPAGELLIGVSTPGAQPLRFKLVGQSNAAVWTDYRFAPVGNARLDYRPGEGLRMSLAANIGDGSSSELVWNDGRAFAFDRLRDPGEAKLVEKGNDPRDAPGVKLLPMSGTTIPQLPALLPLP